MDLKRFHRAKKHVAEALANDLGAFTRSAWPTLHPGSKLSWTWSHDYIVEHLTLVARGEITRLIINCPPRFSKSTIAGICWPVWCWLMNPESAFLCASYEIDLAGSHNLERRRLITSSWFQSLFADRFKLSSDRSLVEEFTNASGGRMLSASTSSRAMGRGGDHILVDDPLSADVAYSDVLRNEVNQWFVNMLPQRLNNPATSSITLIMQRLHEADPTGYVLENSEPGEWTHIKLPLEAPEHQRIVFPISGRVVERKAGDVLDKKRFPPKVVAQRKKNRLVWAGQFQQEPAPLEGNLIRVSDIQFYGGKDPMTGQADAVLPTGFDRKIISADCSFKNLKTSDYVAILTIGIKGSRRYVLNVVNQRLDLDGTESTIQREHSLHVPVNAALVEDAANGIAVITHLKEKISGLIAVTPSGGKMARMAATAPEFQARNWYIDRTAAWANTFITQLTMFPNAKNDDVADSVSQASIWLQSNSQAYGVLDLFRAISAGKKLLGLHSPSPTKVAPDRPSTLKAATRPEELKDMGFDCGCKIPLPIVIAGGQIRCNQCGQQAWPGGKAPAINRGPSRSQVLRQGDSFRKW